MSAPHPYVRDRQALRRSLFAGGLYDLMLGLFMLVAGPWTMSHLGQPLEGPALYWFRLSALPLCILPAIYLTAARSSHLDAFRTPVLALRGLGGGLVLASLLLEPRPAWLVLLIGLLDLGWALLYVILWRRRDGVG
jgi:hypothetical protein